MMENEMENVLFSYKILCWRYVYYLVLSHTSCYMFFLFFTDLEELLLAVQSWLMNVPEL